MSEEEVHYEGEDSVIGSDTERSEQIESLRDALFASAPNTSELWVMSDNLQKALEELNEPENVREKLKRVHDLRRAFNEQNKDVTLIRTDPNFILRFLRVRKFNHDNALLMMTKYHNFRIKRKWPEVNDKLANPSLVRHVFDAGCHVPLKGRARDGSAVCFSRPGKGQNTFSEFAAAMLLTYEKLLDDEDVQIYGITIIYDLTYADFAFFLQYMPIAKRIMSLLQDVIPARLKSVNFVNEPTWFHVYFVTMVRPFLSKKLKNRYRAFGKDIARLHEIVGRPFLPPAYGGIGEPLDGELAKSWADAVCGEATN